MKHLLAILLALLCLPLAQSQQTQPPNFLFIILDDVSMEDLETLQLAQLGTYAPFGRQYTRAYGCPICSPSRYSTQFGRYPHREFIGGALTVANGNDKGAPTTNLSLAETLETCGYSTALFGKWHVNGSALMLANESSRISGGFQTHRAGIVTNIDIVAGGHTSWDRIDDGKRTIETTYTTRAITDEFLVWWGATQGAKFATVAFQAPHEPFDAPPASMLPPGYVVGGTARKKYEAAIVAIDGVLEEIVQVLDLSNTYVFFMADNGTPHQVPPPNPDSPGYKLTMYEGGINVPFIVWGVDTIPGIDSSLIQLMDLPATVLDLAGIIPVTGFEDSISFAPTRQGMPGTRQFAFLTRFTPNNGVAASLTLDYFALVRADGLKLWSQDGVEKLFNLAVDPGETTNQLLNPTYAADLAALRLIVFGDPLAQPPTFGEYGPLWPY